MPKASEDVGPGRAAPGRGSGGWWRGWRASPGVQGVSRCSHRCRPEILPCVLGSQRALCSGLRTAGCKAPSAAAASTRTRSIRAEPSRQRRACRGAAGLAGRSCASRGRRFICLKQSPSPSCHFCWVWRGPAVPHGAVPALLPVLGISRCLCLPKRSPSGCFFASVQLPEVPLDRLATSGTSHFLFCFHCFPLFLPSSALGSCLGSAWSLAEPCLLLPGSGFEAGVCCFP